ncbi:hypothetical protein HETIRDRAFT_407253 [Heterobasidion irregulare TC 32-1]|uniref:Uncharacterized protein n=1 Tax=Heterobasidion irregulare (strain TC 32-1) TaxID=747525 RepID=W4KRJ8_HETIT|nr:uncharacterized protein HETIRDRAFT_407253 [Heterobasidion irregulare TC 32-1]ETW87696.1 hypothetical protein HETIRDRAFT_407253 [Heterobasidion irregulare TC 32-1]
MEFQVVGQNDRSGTITGGCAQNRLRSVRQRLGQVFMRLNIGRQVTGSHTLVGTVHKPPAPALEPVPSPALLERDLVSVTACGPCVSSRIRGWAARAPSGGGS